MDWKKLGENEFETSNGRQDFHLRFEREEWCLDVFDSSNSCDEDAHIESQSFETKDEALEYARNY